MRESRFRSLPPRPAVEILLDGQPVVLPTPAFSSLNQVRRHLELIALRQNRILARLRVDGIDLNLQSGEWEDSPFQSVQATTLTFRELYHKLLTTVQGQVSRLHRRVETTADQILINDWEGVKCLVRELLLEVRSPLVILSFLPELGGVALEAQSAKRPTLTEQMAQLTEIWQHLERCKATQDGGAVFDVLTQKLSPWLRQLNDFLNILA
jgi:hypothetical protein